MLEDIKTENAQPQAEENIDNKTLTTESEIFVPIKFNKQVLNLDLEKAQELAQKGMKFDLISKDYDALKKLAQADNMSVGDFINSIEKMRLETRHNEILEKCGGDSEFAEHVLKLEGNSKAEAKGFSELKESFPQINSIDDLPESVVDAAKIKGTLLLDEYLRYLHCQELAMKNSIKNQRDAENSAMGSLTNRRGAENPETLEFLKGLWRN